MLSKITYTVWLTSNKSLKKTMNKKLKLNLHCSAPKSSKSLKLEHRKPLGKNEKVFSSNGSAFGSLDSQQTNRFTLLQCGKSCFKIKTKQKLQKKTSGKSFQKCFYHGFFSQFLRCKNGLRFCFVYGMRDGIFAQCCVNSDNCTNKIIN